MLYLPKEKISELFYSNDLKSMKEYCEQEKSYLFLHFMYAKLLIKNGMYTEAKNELKPLLNTKYECAARFEFGRIALLNGDLDLARDHFHYVEDYTERQNERENARLEIAKLELECKKLKESKHYFEKILDTKYDETAKLNLGRICYQLEEYEDAKKYFKDLIDTKYDYVARFDLAKTEYALGNVDVARYYFKTSIEKGNNGAVYELGKLEYAEGNYKEAEIAFENCKYQTIYLPKTKYLLGKKEESIEEFKELFNTRDDYQSRLHLAMIYIKDKKYEEAFDVIKNSMASYYSVDSGTKLKVSLSLLKELGVFFYSNYPKYEELTYSDRQIIMYDETNALSHIVSNHTNNTSKNNFNDDINVFDLFHSIKSEITEENMTPSLTFSDMYHVDYPNIGSDGESILRIITLPGTKDIITMFPVVSKRDNVYESEEENTDYSLKTNMLLKKLSTLYDLSQNSDFDLGDVFSDSEKGLLLEIFDIKADKTKTLTK